MNKYKIFQLIDKAHNGSLAALSTYKSSCLNFYGIDEVVELRA